MPRSTLAALREWLHHRKRRIIIAQAFTIDHAGLDLAGYHWPATIEGPEKAIGIVHGLGEHASRYSHVAAHFNAQGYDVFAFDQEGHGRSAGKRGAVRSWAMTVASINSFLSAVRGAMNSASSPLVLYGHSMGGLIALDYLCNRAEASQLSAAIVTSPPIGISFTPSPMLVKAASVLQKVIPNVTKSNELDPNHLSRDAGVVSMYTVDPLVHDKVSILLGSEMLTRGAALRKAGYHHQVPVLLMHGTADGVTSHPASEDFVQSSTGNVTFKSWPDYYHELHNEPNNAEVLEYISHWLDTKLTTT